VKSAEENREKEKSSLTIDGGIDNLKIKVLLYITRKMP